jgi:dTDP-4-dehydrorhamnose reductase
MTRILITGGTGQVGTELARQAWPAEIELVLPTRQELDLSDAMSVRAYVLDGGFDVVINPAAYTAVDKAESDCTVAFGVNALAPAALADATRTLGIPLVHVSTDYVFDGSKDGPYDESDPIVPINVYGASKAAGEHAVRLGNPRHVILRTAWVFSAHGNNFVKTMLKLADRPQLRVVDDQHGCPTAAADIARTLATITLRMIEDPAAPVGTFHFVNDGATTWCEFAREIFRQERDTGIAVPEVEAIGTADYPTPARRPANSVLSVARLARDYGIKPRPWSEALRETLATLRTERSKGSLS